MLIDWLVEAVCDVQEKGEDLVLATVLKKSGSAPCLAGAKMIVRREGQPIGSIGGGALEAGALKLAKQVFDTRTSRIMRFNLSGADAASMQMICGGQVEVLVEFIPCITSNIKVFQGLRNALANGEKCYLMAEMGSGSHMIPDVSRFVAREDGSVIGNVSLSSEMLTLLKNKAFKSTYPVLVDRKENRYFVERCFAPSTLYIFGAGHVSRQLATLAEMATFRLVVLDDREEFANRDRFPAADEVIVLDSFDRCCTGVKLDNDSYVVIVTRGHMHDGTVLRQVLGKNARYIGMMGSKRKRNELFRLLAGEGFSEEELGRVHCPIGLPIKAETQIEIAFSIMAELILARASERDAAAA
jgi:xanthine dehydrogenase accessory factor